MFPAPDRGSGGDHRTRVRRSSARGPAALPDASPAAEAAGAVQDAAVQVSVLANAVAAERAACSTNLMPTSSVLQPFISTAA